MKANVGVCKALEQMWPLVEYLWELDVPSECISDVIDWSWSWGRMQRFAPSEKVLSTSLIHLAHSTREAWVVSYKARLLDPLYGHSHSRKVQKVSQNRPSRCALVLFVGESGRDPRQAFRYKQAYRNFRVKFKLRLSPPKSIELLE